MKFVVSLGVSVLGRWPLADVPTDGRSDKSERRCVRVCIVGVLPAKRRPLCDEGVLGDTRAWRAVLHDHVLERRRDRGRLEGHLSRLAVRQAWTVTSSSTRRGPATTGRSATARSLRPVRRCTFSGGTGKFTHFQATAAVSLPLGGPGGPNFSWTGTYSFSPRD